MKQQLLDICTEGRPTSPKIAPVYYLKNVSRKQHKEYPNCLAVYLS